MDKNELSECVWELTSHEIDLINEADAYLLEQIERSHCRLEMSLYVHRSDFTGREVLALWFGLCPTNPFHLSEIGRGSCQNNPVFSKLSKAGIPSSFIPTYQELSTKNDRLLYQLSVYFKVEHEAVVDCEEWARDSLLEFAENTEQRPAFLFPDNKERYAKARDNKHFTIPAGLDQSVIDRLQAMIDAANHFWGESGCADNGTTNKIAGAWIGKKVDVSPTVAEQMASITRPDYAKHKTWADNKRQD